MLLELIYSSRLPLLSPWLYMRADHVGFVCYLSSYT